MIQSRCNLTHLSQGEWYQKVIPYDVLCSLSNTCNLKVLTGILGLPLKRLKTATNEGPTTCKSDRILHTYTISWLSLKWFSILVTQGYSLAGKLVHKCTSFLCWFNVSFVYEYFHLLSLLWLSHFRPCSNAHQCKREHIQFSFLCFWDLEMCFPLEYS